MSEWQPIETAPRDGTAVLLYEPDCWMHPVWVAQWERGGTYYREGWRCFVAADGEEVLHPEKPTHWMPLPEPPEPSI